MKQSSVGTAAPGMQLVREIPKPPSSLLLSPLAPAIADRTKGNNHILSLGAWSMGLQPSEEV